nr:hypothetical protein [Candidatus Brocadiales bacterium]
MDLNPQIEKTNRQQEKSIVDMTWDVKDIVSMVQLGIMSVETSQEILGLNPKQEGERTKQTEASDITEMFASGNVFNSEHTCGDCVYWDGSKNHCSIHKIEKTFDDNICRQFSLGELDANTSTADII